jgi:hypothetical protein
MWESLAMQTVGLIKRAFGDICARHATDNGTAMKRLCQREK